MSTIFYLSIILCVILYGSIESAAETVECNYGVHFATLLKNTPRNLTEYGCLLKNVDENATDINRQHVAGKNDDDILILKCESNDILNNFSPIYCQKFNNLIVIYTNDAHIRSMEEDSLYWCPNLKVLSLEGNKFTELHKNLLTRNSELLYIRIIDSSLRTLPEEFFVYQWELEELDLRNNQINSLPSNLFNPLARVKSLFLSGNKLDAIDPQWFIYFRKLEKLEIKRNKIREIPSDIFKSLDKVTWLSLEDNKIKSLDPGSFNGLKKLEELSLSSNQISELEPNVFAPLRKLKGLAMYNNLLKTIHSDSFNIPNDLILLNLFNNKINSIDPKLIVNNVFALFNLMQNRCGNFMSRTDDKLEIKLKTCFENYKPRNQAELPDQPEFVTSIETKITEDLCGKSFAAQGNIIGGTYVKLGEFPWNGAIVKANGKFFCGCTLISARKALTAAHCIQPKGSTTALQASEIFVLLGIHDLSNAVETGRDVYAVQHIQMHDDWNPSTQTFDADIAVLVLESPVNFNKNIQPICLIPPDSDIQFISNSFVAGFGQSENSSETHENVAKILDLPIHTFQKCFKDFPVLDKLASGRTFCAGSGKGIGVCRGDSGSGVFVNQDGTYFLRGIVSSSINSRPFGCDLDSYALFTDVVKYYDWISSIQVEESVSLELY